MSQNSFFECFRKKCPSGLVAGQNFTQQTRFRGLDDQNLTFIKTFSMRQKIVGNILGQRKEFKQHFTVRTSGLSGRGSNSGGILFVIAASPYLTLIARKHTASNTWTLQLCFVQRRRSQNPVLVDFDFVATEQRYEAGFANRRSIPGAFRKLQ